MKREIVFRPAYDKRHPNPNKNYGIHGVDMQWYVSGELGVVQFVVYTNWYLPHVRAEGEQKRWDAGAWQPMAADLGYHSPKPMYEGQTSIGDCGLLGGDCYYDGSGLNAKPILEKLIAEGGEAAWKELEDYYVETFGELK